MEHLLNTDRHSTFGAIVLTNVPAFINMLTLFSEITLEKGEELW